MKLFFEKFNINEDYTLRQGKHLKDVIEYADAIADLNGDYTDVVLAIEDCILELNDEGIINDSECREYLSHMDFVDRSDPKTIDNEISDFFDFCNDHDIIIPN